MPVRIPTVRTWWRHLLPALMAGVLELVALRRARRSSAVRSTLPSRVRLS